MWQCPRKAGTEVVVIVVGVGASKVACNKVVEAQQYICRQSMKAHAGGTFCGGDEIKCKHGRCVDPSEVRRRPSAKRRRRDALLAVWHSEDGRGGVSGP